jgi:hypothetical protein
MKKIFFALTVALGGWCFQLSARITNVITYAGTGIAGLYDASLSNAQFRQHVCFF